MLKHGLLPIFTLLSLLACNGAMALTVSIPDNFRTRSVGPGVEYLSVADRTRTIRDMLGESGWQEVTTPQPGFGFDERVHWLRFDLLNKHRKPHNLLITVPYSYLDEVDLYLVDQKGQVISHQKSGDQRGMQVRQVSHPENIHPLALQPGERLSVYIRVDSTSSLSIPIQLWEQNAYQAFDYSRTTALGIFLGLMIMFTLYHLVMATLTRDRSAVFYTVFVASVLVTFAYRKGIPPSLFPTSHLPPTEMANIVAMSLTGFSLCFFTSNILRLSQARPAMARLLHLAGVIALAPALAHLILDYSVAIRVSLGYSLLLISFYAVVVIRRLADGFPPAKPMIIGSIFGIAGNGLGILSSVELAPITFTLEAFIYTSNALMVLFFALTLSYRINMDRMLLEEAQRQHAHELDELVRQRTEELEKVNEQLRVVSITDGLTGLYNRRHFDQALDAAYNRAFREKHSLAILLIDIDHFKRLNDTHGHAFGDLCLQETGEIIKNALRRPLDLAARYGGEEFVILLPHTELPGALHLAEVIRKAMESKAVENKGAQASMTVSIGVAVETPAQQDHHEALLQWADQQLYRAKHNGRNRVEHQGESGTGVSPTAPPSPSC